MRVISKQSFIPRAFEHWDRKLGFGTRIEIQACQYGRRALSLLGALPLWRASLENRIQNLQESPYRFSDAFNREIARTVMKYNAGFQLISFVPWLRCLLEYAVEGGPFTMLGAGISGAMSLVALISGHFIKNLSIKGKIAGHQIETRTQRLEESKEKYRNLFQNAPIGFHNVSPEGIILDVNHRWLEVMGYEKNEVIRHSIFDFIVPEQRENARVRFEERIKNGKPKTFKEGDRLYLRKDGTQIPIQTHDTVIKDGGGRIILIQTSLVDLTERRQRELREREQAASGANRETLAGIADRLAQYGAGVIGGVDLVLHHLADLREQEVFTAEQYQELLSMLGDAQEGADKIGELISLIRKFLSPRVTDYFEQDVRMVLKEILEKELARHKIVLEEDPDLPKVRADSENIKVILSFFLRKAFRAADQNKGKIWVKLEKYNGGVRILVKDNGEQDKTLILEDLKKPFYRVDTFEHIERLHLATAIRYIELLDGKIEIDRDKESGTTITICLPGSKT